MYCRFYGLIRPPFEMTPDPGFLYLGETHREGLATLVYGVRSHKGFVMLTGEVGTGKTTLLHALLAQLDAKSDSAYIFNPCLEPLDFFKLLFEDFGIEATCSTKAEYLLALNHFLIDRLQKNRTVLLIIDEAQNLSREMLEEIRETTRRIALELGVVGLINIQYGVAGGELYVIEANPRASRTVPFVSKATGVPLAKVAARLMLGEKLADQDLREPPTGMVSVKEAVLPFARFAGADSVLGPEMKSTGEVMGIAADFPTAFGKAQAAAGVSLPTEGAVFITVTDTDKPAATQIAARFHDLGFELIATGGTAQAISAMGVPVTPINKIAEGSPHVVDLIRERRCALVINTPTGSGARADGYEIRTAAVRHGIPCVTTMTGATAAVRAIAATIEGDSDVRSLQEIHDIGAASSAPADA